MLTHIAGQIRSKLRLSLVFGTLLLAALMVSSLALASRAESFVYWPQHESIARADLDGSDVDPTFIPNVRSHPFAIAVDPGHVYWVHERRNSSDTLLGYALARADLDGSDVDLTFIPDLGAILGDVYQLAVDDAHVYWAYGSPFAAKTGIGRANLDGSGVEPDFITSVGPGPYAGPDLYSAVAVGGGHVYWANGMAATIGRADLDGGNIDADFIDAWDIPIGGLATDSAYIYWISRPGGPAGGGRALGRAAFDASVLDRALFRVSAGALAVGGGHVYWTGADGASIGRARVDGSGMRPNLIPGIRAEGITVDSGTFPETTIISGPVGSIAVSSATLTFGSDHTGATFACRLDEARKFTPCASPKTYDGLAEGRHSFRVRAADPGAYADPSPATRNFKVDLTPPTTRIQERRGKTTKMKLNYRFTSSEGGSSFECKLDQKKWKPCESPKTLKGLERGRHTFKVRATDEAGNTDPSPANDRFRVISKG